jgi:4-hydroxy-3-polyprenylbenzoate decarboxylase
MALDTQAEFIRAIEGIGELVRIRRPVRTELEIAEIADRVMKSPGGGPALLFEAPVLDDGTTSPIPVGINLFGSMRRMGLALGVERLDDIGDRIADMLNLKVPDGLFGKLAMLPKLAEIAKFPPRTRGGRAPCQAVVRQGAEVNLDALPALRTWPQDGGRYLTFPMVITRDPGSGVRNVGMYRVQLLDRTSLAMHWQRHKVGAAHWREMAARGEKMPVVIACTRPRRRCRPPSTSSSSRASCAVRRWSWRRPSPATWRCRPRPTWCWRGTSTRPRTW